MDERRRIGRRIGMLGFVTVAGLALFLFFRTGGVEPTARGISPTTSEERTPSSTRDEPTPAGDPSTSSPSAASTTTTIPVSRYDPVAAGETLPKGYRELLPRDAIRPVYRPSFVRAADVAWNAEALVIGVVVDGEAKAYPVSYLNSREMVVDRLSGIPILVTW
jgi:hypothetical protein